MERLDSAVSPGLQQQWLHDPAEASHTDQVGRPVPTRAADVVGDAELEPADRDAEVG